MDLETLRTRLNAIVNSASFRGSMFHWSASAASSKLNSQQLPVMEVPIYHDRVTPGPNNLPSCAYNVVSSTQGELR